MSWRSVCEEVVQDAHSQASPWGWSPIVDIHFECKSRARAAISYAKRFGQRIQRKTLFWSPAFFLHVSPYGKDQGCYFLARSRVIWVSKRRRNQDEFIHNLKATHPYNLRYVCENVVQDAHSQASPWGWSPMFGCTAWKQIAPTICDMYAKMWSKMHTLKLALGGDLR